MGSKEIDDMESTLKELPSYKKYEEFSKLVNEKTCKENFTDLLKLQVQRNNITEFCNNISGIIQHMSDQKEKNYISENCAYLNFYIYHRVKIKFRSHSEVINKILNNIYLVWYIVNRKLLENKCSFIYYHNNDVINKWNDMKVIYDYKENYNYIKDNTKNYETCKTYEKYLNNVKIIYDQKNIECCQNDKGQCNIYSFECNTIKHPGILLQEINCPGLAEDNSRETEADGNKDSSDNGSLKTSMVAISPFIGILVSFFFSYKFSPLGSWLRSKIQQTVNIKDIPYNEDTEELLAYESEYADINPNNIPYNISYKNI
ncbi:PIR Superfamily Protein [Plasmodium ovale curtisi]|uniref:PIR Superfamily Protein n=1 Tax=Plasmodium ovale curtisi TaxID=864141 RepID=A0A1A8X8M0_PLAOA|nr:PIR Superfamily Protein [Plasmodium ovale curtisi]